MLEHQEQPLVNGAPSYWVANDRTEVYVSEQGGQMAPINFKLKHRWVAPTSLPPWEPGQLDSRVPPVTQLLRGDFFCLPYGESRKCPYPHGDPANEKWRLVERTVRSLKLQLDMPHTGGRITRNLWLRDGERAVYQENKIEGLQGRFSYGNQTVLEFPEGGHGWVNTSAFRFGQVTPEPYNNPAQGRYGWLKPGASFTDLAAVPGIDGSPCDVRQWPAREGYDDLLMVSAAADDAPFAWSAVTMNGYIFLQLKKPSILPSTLLWFSNGGRHEHPWGGNHRRRLAIAEVCSYFEQGLEASRKSPLKASHGIATVGSFSKRTPFTVRLIQAAHPVPKAFGVVVDVYPSIKPDEVTAIDATGLEISLPLRWEFVQG